MSEKQERRTIRLDVAGLKVERREDGTAKVGGYAAVFNRDSENLGWFVERIRPGAFKNALKKADVRALMNHDSNKILGRTTAGTLRLKEDETGLRMEYDDPGTSYSIDLLKSIERGDITGQSFGFTVRAEEWSDLDKEVVRRTIVEVGELVDVGPVTFPAYPDTSVAKRSMDEARKANNSLRGAQIEDEQKNLQIDILTREI